MVTANVRIGQFGSHLGEPLSQAWVDQLDDGTKITVTWSGGNGPHNYIVAVDVDGRRYACTKEEYEALSDDSRLRRSRDGRLDFVGKATFHESHLGTHPAEVTR